MMLDLGVSHVFEGRELSGRLRVPAGARTAVLFCHGRGSNHRSVRNGRVAEALLARGIATLVVDLVSPKTAAGRSIQVEISDFAECAESWLDQVTSRYDGRSWRLGLFGASIGAGAALTIAARRRSIIAGVVCRGGRVDIPKRYLARITTPTLMIVGEHDKEFRRMNERAYGHLGSEIKRIHIVRGAGHLFAEPLTLDEVAVRTVRWFSAAFRSDPARYP